MMTIPWLYLDKRLAAVNALKDFNSMKRTIDSYEDDWKEARSHLTSVHAPVLTHAPRAASGFHPRAAESQMASTLDLMDVIEKRYSQALEYMAWFQPAWDALSKCERDILSAFYLNEEISRSEVVQQLCAALGYEKSTVYSRKDKALGHLALLLYGK